MLPLVGRQPERVEIFDVFPFPAADPMSAQPPQIVEVEDARGMAQRFDRDVQITAPIDQVNVGERRVAKLQFFS